MAPPHRKDKTLPRREIAYFYSTHSAYAYLGARRLMDICAEHGCRLVHRPFELSPVIEQAGAQRFARRDQAHVDYFFGRELERWAAFRGLPMIDHRPTHHDNPLSLSSGMVIAADQMGADVDALSFAILEAHWRDDIDLMDAQALAQAASRAGLDPAPLLAAAMSDPVQARFRANTDAALALNLFGSPTYVLEGDPFYGQDHLEMLAFALTTPFPAPRFRNPPVGG